VRRALCTLFALAVCASASGASARELFRSGDASLDLSGSFRERLTATQGTDADRFRAAFDPGNVRFDPSCIPVQTFPDCSAWDAVAHGDSWVSLSRLRLELDGRLNRSLSAVVVYDLEGRIGRRETLGSPFASDFQTRQFLDLEDDLSEHEDAQWRQLLYRAYALYESDRLEVTVGRQRIPWGVGRLWNPIDRFNAIPPLAIEADQSPGVDAVKARWLFSGFTFLDAIYGFGYHADDRSYATRLGGVLWDVDYGLVAGVFEEAPTFGFDLATNLGDAAGRAEVVWTAPKRRVRPFGETRKEALDPYWQVLVSVDHNFDVGDGIYVLVEYLFNGNDLGFGRGEAAGAVNFFQEQDVLDQRVIAPGTTDLFGQSRVISLAQHLTGVQLGYDLTTDLRGDVVALYDWKGESVALFPSLRYSPTGWLELTLGVQLFEGRDRSEYGNGETLGFAIAEVFF
jgi:hypothetical protein